MAKGFPIVITLDAGGTNSVFSAIQGSKEVATPVIQPSQGHDLELCLRNIIDGFRRVIDQLEEKPVAISFAFPGPADYRNGIIGDLGNLPGFRGGVALGPMLEEQFQIPVYINNDGDLFTLGEAIYGFLPFINSELQKNSSSLKFSNLFGVTLGTGLGGGLVHNGKLYTGDNGAATEIWLLNNPFRGNSYAEESLSARAIVREYMANSKNSYEKQTPFDIYQIAKGLKPGDQEAALKAFQTFGTALGDVLSQIISIVDAPVVIGGGLSNAYDLFATTMMQQLHGSCFSFTNTPRKRLVIDVYNIEEHQSLVKFATNTTTIVKVPFSNKTAGYNIEKKICMGTSKLGTSKAVWLGAYAFAIEKLQQSGHL